MGHEDNNLVTFLHVVFPGYPLSIIVIIIIRLDLKLWRSRETNKKYPSARGRNPPWTPFRRAETCRLCKKVRVVWKRGVYYSSCLMSPHASCPTGNDHARVGLEVHGYWMVVGCHHAARPHAVRKQTAHSAFENVRGFAEMRWMTTAATYSQCVIKKESLF